MLIRVYEVIGKSTLGFILSIALWSLSASAEINTNTEKASISRNNSSENESAPLKRQLSFKSIEQGAIQHVGGITAITQDDDGFLWVGGEQGLARFDGNEFRLYIEERNNPNSISNKSVSDLLIDNQKQLWIATAYGLNRYNVHADTFTQIVNQENSNQENDVSVNGLESLYQDEAGVIWIGTDRGYLNRYDPNSQSKSSFDLVSADQRALKADYITYAITRADDEHLWLGGQYGLVKFHKPSGKIVERFQHDTNDKASLNHNEVHSLLLDKNNELWVGTRAGFNHFDPITKKFKRIQIESPNNNITELSYHVSDIAEDKNGLLWLALDGLGLVNYERNSDSLVHYSNKNENVSGLVNENVRKLFLDQRGNIWVGHYPAGLSVLDHSTQAFLNYTQGKNNYSLTNSDVLSVTEDENGYLWVGTEQGFNQISMQDGTVKQYPFNPNSLQSVSSAPVISLNKGLNNTLYVASWEGGLSLFDIDNAKLTRHPGVAIDSSTSFTHIDNNKRLWVGGHEGLTLFSDLSLDAKGKLIRAEPVVSFLETEKGNIWFGDYGALHELDNQGNILNRYYVDEFLPDEPTTGAITSMIHDGKNTIWMATRGGVRTFNTESRQFKALTTDDGLPDNTTGCIVKEDEEHYWFGTRTGLARLNTLNGKFKNFSISQGLPGNNFKSRTCIKLSSGELVFGSTKGLTLFSPAKLLANEFNPKVFITNFQFVDSNENPRNLLQTNIVKADKIKIKHNQNAFSLTFSALNIISPDEVEYLYQLEGYDEGWQSSGKTRTVTYAGIPAGDYKFRVKTTMQTDQRDANQTLEISIEASRWFSNTAMVIYTIIILSLAIFASYLIKRKINEEKKRALEEIAKQNEQTRVEKSAKNLPQIIQGMEEQKLYLDHTLNVKNFAERVGLSSRDVSAAIKHHKQCNFAEFVNTYRIQEAKRLLMEEKSKSVTDVMLDSGFNSRSAFYRLFKADCGVSPSEYRGKNKE